MSLASENLRYKKDRNSRPHTNGERAQSRITFSSGANHNAASGNGCFPWHYYELQSRDMNVAPDLYKNNFQMSRRGFILKLCMKSLVAC